MAHGLLAPRQEGHVEGPGDGGEAHLMVTRKSKERQRGQGQDSGMFPLTQLSPAPASHSTAAGNSPCFHPGQCAGQGYL